MRKLFFTAILFISMGTMAFAQTEDKKQQRTPEEKAQRATDALDKKLALTTDQKAKIYALNLDGIKKAKENHVKGEKRDHSKMKAALEERDNKINSILNDQQRASYKELKAKRFEAMKDHAKKRKGPKGEKGAKGEKTPEKV